MYLYVLDIKHFIIYHYIKIKLSGIGAVAQWFKPTPVTPASHISMQVRFPTALLLIQFPVTMPGKAAENVPRVWASSLTFQSQIELNKLLPVTLTFPLIKYFLKPTAAKHLLPWLHSVPRNSHAQYLIPRATVSRDVQSRDD